MKYNCEGGEKKEKMKYFFNLILTDENPLISCVNLLVTTNLPAMCLISHALQ